MCLTVPIQKVSISCSFRGMYIERYLERFPSSMLRRQTSATKGSIVSSNIMSELETKKIHYYYSHRINKDSPKSSNEVNLLTMTVRFKHFCRYISASVTPRAITCFCLQRDVKLSLGEEC